MMHGRRRTVGGRRPALLPARFRPARRRGRRGVLGGLLAPALGDVAAIAVLEQSGLAVSGWPFPIAATFSFVPVMLTVLVLTVAEAFRRGAALTDELV